MTESLGSVDPNKKLQAYLDMDNDFWSFLKGHRFDLHYLVRDLKTGPLIRRPLVHVLEAPTVREQVVNFLEKETDLWDRALNPKLAFADLEEAWEQVFEELRPLVQSTFGFVSPVPTREAYRNVVEMFRGPSQPMITLRIFRRIYTSYVLRTPCNVGCASSATDPCGDTIGGVIIRRFKDSVRIEDTQYANFKWYELRGMPLQAFKLLVMVHTALFVADMADSRTGQQRIGAFLATCQDRFLHIVNHGKDDLSLNRQKVDTEE